MGILIGFLLLTLFILIHEAGHMAVARSLGVRVRAFCLGIGTRPLRWASWKSRRSGVTYGLAAFPIGGMVDIQGMVRPGLPMVRAIPQGDPSVLSALDAHVGGWDHAPDARTRLGSAESGPGCFRLPAGLADAMAAGTGTDLGTDGTYRAADIARGIRESGVGGDCRDKAAASLSDLLAFLDACDGLGLPVSVSLEASSDARDGNFYTKSFLPKAAILVSGSLSNILTAWLIMVVLAFGYIRVPAGGTGIGRVLPDSPAAKAGIVAGDSVVGYDKGGKTVPVDSFEGMLGAKAAGATEFVFETAAGEPVVLRIEPKGTMGVMAETRVPGVAEGIGESFRLFGGMAGMMWDGYATLFSGESDVPLHKAVAGPIGILRSTGAYIDTPAAAVGDEAKGLSDRQAAWLGIRNFLYMWAMISMSLGILNLLPLPPLDGGKVLEEALRPLTDRYAWAATGVGYLSTATLVLLLFVMLAANVNDVVSLFAG